MPRSETVSWPRLHKGRKRTTRSIHRGWATIIGPRVRKRREALGLTSADLARKAKLRPEYLTRLEAGLHEPTLPNLVAVAKGLGVTLDDLLPLKSR